MASGRTFMRWLTTIVVLAAIALWIAWATRPKPLQVQTATVERGTVEKTVANTRAGTVTACRRARLSPSTGGQILRLPVSEGDMVKRGQLLLELWNRDLKAQLTLVAEEAASAEATARARCIEADQAAREAARQRRLLARKLVSEEQADQANSSASAAGAACEAAEASAAVARARTGFTEAQLEKTRLIAPFDGVVAEINGELSEYVTPSPVGVATPPAVDLIDNNCFYLSAPIDEVDVSAIRVGMAARITLDAFDERRFDGRVRRVADYVLDQEKQARTVDVEVEFVNKDDIRELLAGYSADVEVILSVHRDTLRVPSEAVFDGDQVYFYDPEGGLVERRRVEVGISNWDHTELLSGLDAGEQLVTTVDRDGLADGVEVRPEDAGNP